MSSKAGSSIGTFLMSMPVSAMVLMGIFGVPRFAPGVGGESGWQNAKQFFTSLTSNESEATPGRPAFPGFAADPHAPGAFPDEAPQWGGSQTSVDPELSRPVQDPRNSAVSTRGGFVSDQSSHPFVNRGAGSHASVHTGSRSGQSVGNTPATITWSEARHRLADLGIEQFHLGPGLDGDHFLFACLLTPGGDERITRRFEAEANEPLAAVQAVLTQIDEWLARQYAQDTRAPGPFGSR